MATEPPTVKIRLDMRCRLQENSSGGEIMRSRLYGAMAVLVLAVAPACADPAFNGRWSISPTGCTIFGDTTETAPLILTDTTVNWWVASCTIKKSYRIGEGLYLEARCSSEGRTYTMPIGLQMQGQKLRVTWDKTIAGVMQRCR